MSGTDYTLTTNLGLYKPVANADVNAWGAHLNSNADMLDSAVHSIQIGGPFLPLNGGGTLSPAYLRLDGSAGTDRPLWFSTSLSSRWKISATNDAESGNSAGSNLGVYAYADNGSYIGCPLSISRASGPTGLGLPDITELASWRQSYLRPSQPNSIIGNRQDVGVGADRQPVMPLGNNPFATTAGSPTITVTWVGSCNATTGAWIGANTVGQQTWIKLAGATAVGGITPNGWLLVQTIVDNDHFTVTWIANATAIATGGGNAVTAQPSHCTATNRIWTQTTNASFGFPNQTSELWEVAPDFTQPLNSPTPPRYEHRWHWTVGPNDAAGISAFNIVGIEWDLTNRGHDFGYYPDLSRQSQPSIAFWVGPIDPPPWATAGGVATNWDAVYTVYAGQSATTQIGVYQAFSCMPNSLVGQAFDSTGHGGVGVDLFGSYTWLANNPFTTATGSSTVTVSLLHPPMLIGMANGNQVYIPNSYTVNGVTFGAATYTIAGVNTGAGTFTITGTGTASATGSGGGNLQALSFVPLAPYAPMQTWGLFRHGIVTALGSHFLSGGIIETQPGSGILWNDGTGTASINTVSSGAGNIGVTITTAGTGVVNIAGHAATAATTPASFSADHRVAIQVAGTTYYLPVSTTAW